MKIIPGLDNLLQHHPQQFEGRKIGIVAHPASTTSSLLHILPALRQAGASIEALFGPEHGFGGEAQDMEPVSSPSRNCDGIPLFSLYGTEENSLSPDPEVIGALDALVVDLADVGSRYYTFVWTALLCLRVCHRAGIPMILTDRPNPLNGVDVEGSPQRPDCLSFVGLFPVPVRHGLTVGEILTMAARREGIEDALTVIPMIGWKRSMYFNDTGMVWIPPSPNMPTLNTALVYPGGCLLEATAYSEGRGTTTPFECFGAPKLDKNRLCGLLNAQQLPGVFFRPISFKPSFQKHAGQHCTGAYIHVTDRQAFLPYRTGITLLWALRQSGPSLFQWRPDPYEFVCDIPAIDLLCGTPCVRLALEDGATPVDIWHQANGETAAFSAVKPDFHLY